MNTYDPSDYIVYVRMDRTPAALTVSWSPAEHQLPSGYANQSPRTSLRTRTRTAIAPRQAALQRWA